MAYDSGIASLTKAGLAEDFIEKRGVPRDQIVPFLSSVSNRQGYGSMNPELAGLIAKKMALENAVKQEQAVRSAPPSAPPTVRQDIEQLAAVAEQRNAGLPATNISSPVSPRGMASGGIVAFADGGMPSGIDFSKMTSDQLEMLAQGEDRALARAAYGEYLRRSGYRSPGQLASDVGSGIYDFFANTRIAGGAPDYMRDDQGRIRTPASEAGVKSVTSSFTQGIVPLGKREGTQAAVSAATPPTSVATPVDMMGGQRGPAFSGAERTQRDLDEAMRGKPREEVRQKAPVSAPARAAAAPAERVPAIKSVEEYEKDLVDMYSKRGIGKATEEYRQYLKDEMAKGEKAGKVDTGLALAKAGFRMMASTSPFAAVAIGEGGQELAEQLAAVRKEQQAANRSMRQAQFQLAQADEMQAAGRIKDAMGMRKDAEAKLERENERREMMDFRYASLRSEERRAAAMVDMQKTVLKAREESDVRRQAAMLAAAKQKAVQALSSDMNFMNLQSALQKAVDSGDKTAIKKAETAVRNYRDAYLAPIESELSMMSSETSWDSLAGE